MADLTFTPVIGRFGINVGDGSDPGEDPDTIWCDEGILRIAPLQSPTKVMDGTPWPFTTGNAAIDTTFNPQGHVTWNGKPRVLVVDLTSENLIPHVAEGEATHRLTFIGVKADGVAVDFPPANVRLAGDTMTLCIDPETGDEFMACDLTKLMPVPVGPGVAIVVGPQGRSVEALSVESGELVVEFDDGTTETAGELPVGPGGSDPGVAGYLSVEASATSAAALARVKADLQKSSGSVLAPVVTAQNLAGITEPGPISDALSVKTAEAVEAAVGDPITKADLGLDQVDNTHDVDKPVSLATQELVDSRFPGLSKPVAGRYGILSSPAATTTTATLGAGNLRLTPIFLLAPATIDRLGVDIGSLGEAGAKYRVGIYSDAGHYPGALILDAGQIAVGAGDTAGVVYADFAAMTLDPGIYWVGGATQSAPTTEPTVRTASANWTPPITVTIGSIASAATNALGLSRTGVTGALPATFGAGNGGTGTVPRMLARFAA